MEKTILFIGFLALVAIGLHLAVQIALAVIGLIIFLIFMAAIFLFVEQKKASTSVDASEFSELENALSREKQT